MAGIAGGTMTENDYLVNQTTFNNFHMIPLFIGGIGMKEVLLIALVVLLFFGGRKIPELMKGIGKGVRSFKEGMNGMEKEISPENTDKKEE